jgi:hypothetical protein
MGIYVCKASTLKVMLQQKFRCVQVALWCLCQWLWVGRSHWAAGRPSLCLCSECECKCTAAGSCNWGHWMMLSLLQAAHLTSLLHLPPSPSHLACPCPLSCSKQHDFGSDIIPGAKDLGAKVQAHLFKGYWEDIGTVRAFYESNLALTDSPNPNFRCGECVLGWVHGWMGAPCVPCVCSSEAWNQHDGPSALWML